MPGGFGKGLRQLQLAAGGPGDKVQAHVSEEELGVTTTPTNEEAAS